MQDGPAIQPAPAAKPAHGPSTQPSAPTTMPSAADAQKDLSKPPAYATHPATQPSTRPTVAPEIAGDLVVSKTFGGVAPDHRYFKQNSQGIAVVSEGAALRNTGKVFDLPKQAAEQLRENGVVGIQFTDFNKGKFVAYVDRPGPDGKTHRYAVPMEVDLKGKRIDGANPASVKKDIAYIEGLMVAATDKIAADAKVLPGKRMPDKK